MKTRARSDATKGGVQQTEGEAPPGPKEESASSSIEPSGTERDAQSVRPAAGISPSAEERLASLEMILSQLQGFGRPSLGPHAIPGGSSPSWLAALLHWAISQLLGAHFGHPSQSHSARLRNSGRDQKMHFCESCFVRTIRSPKQIHCTQKSSNNPQHVSTLRHTSC